MIRITPLTDDQINLLPKGSIDYDKPVSFSIISVTPQISKFTNKEQLSIRLCAYQNGSRLTEVYDYIDFGTGKYASEKKMKDFFYCIGRFDMYESGNIIPHELVDPNKIVGSFIPKEKTQIKNEETRKFCSVESYIIEKFDAEPTKTGFTDNIPF